MRRALGLIATIVALAILAVVAVALLRGVLGAARLSTGVTSAEPDPMFAEPAERVTRPPQDEDMPPVVSADEDPSRDWVYETLTPVERTAAELAETP